MQKWSKNSMITILNLKNCKKKSVLEYSEENFNVTVTKTATVGFSDMVT